MRRRAHSTNSTALSFAKETCDGRSFLQKSPVINNRARFGWNWALLNVMGRKFRFRKSRNILFGHRGALFCVCACVCVCVRVYKYSRMSIYICMCRMVSGIHSVCACSCVYICFCTCVCSCVHMYSYMKNMYIMALHMQSSHTSLDKQQQL